MKKLVIASERLFHAPIASRCIRSNACRLINSTRQLLNLAPFLHSNVHTNAFQHDRIQIQASQRPLSLRCSSSSDSATTADPTESTTTGSFSQ
jgi:hypothetical protein